MSTPWARGWGWIAAALAIASLLVACRRAPLGTAVADDYSFLEWLRLHRLDLFDSMGATFYWRPVSRQLYYALIGPWMLDAPWGVALLHGAFLLLTAWLVYRILRRRAPAQLAAAAAAFVLASEPARALLTWPSGGQHLLAGLLAVLAVHEALAGRIGVAALAALAGVLSHESAALALPVVPLAAWAQGRGRRAVISATAASVAVVVVWAAGYAVALRHGVRLPSGHEGAAGSPLLRLPSLFAHALWAAVSLEDVHGTMRTILVLGMALTLGYAVVRLASARRGSRRRLPAPPSVVPTALAAAAWFAIGILPLAALLPDWNAWRAWTPTLGFAVASTLPIAAASPWLGASWIALRLVALLASPIGPLDVTKYPPENTSHESFAQLVRLQHLVAGSRGAMLEALPSLPRGAHISYWEMPRLAEFAFQGSRALHVWYADSTLEWRRFGGRSGLDAHFAAGLEFRYGQPRVAVVIPGRSIAFYQEAGRLMTVHRYAEADSPLVAAVATLGNLRGPYYGSLLLNRAICAYNVRSLATADSLLRAATPYAEKSIELWSLRAAIAIVRGDRVDAEEATRRALDIDPESAVARDLASRLGMTP